MDTKRKPREHHREKDQQAPVEKVPGFHFQPKDGEILVSIDDHGGILARRHLQTLFWPEASLRAMLRRLAQLVEQDFLGRPTREQWRSHPIPEAVYWLGWRGALWLAEQQGLVVEPPKTRGENQLRAFQQQLKKHGIHWLREPSWNTVAHEIALVDFQLALERAMRQLPAIRLLELLHDRDFRAQLDRVHYQYRGAGGQVTQGQRGVCPDLFFVLADLTRQGEGKPFKLPLLVEIDLGTHPVASRFGQEKAAPYAAYLKSPAYQGRFGYPTGGWLVVTTGERRMKHLMQQTQAVVGKDAEYFFFSTLGDFQQGNLLSDPIWRKAAHGDPVSLLAI